ncbi:MAG: PilZ domain-containing protein [Candidatus Omnitrophota bacterium]|nr:MAG: PilZ domain-containing protein [Candidatus Omnitrophota bacterium]
MSWDSAERRQFIRATFPCEIMIPGPQHRVILAHVKNISAGGVRVIIKERLQNSSLVKLNIYGVNEKAIVCKGRVRWVFSRKVPPRTGILVFDTGIEFYEIEGEDIREIKNLVASISSGKCTYRKKPEKK